MDREWLASGKLQWNDPDLSAYTSRLLAPIEHNFGLDTHKVITDARHDSMWTNAQFHPVMNDVSTGYPGLTEYSTDRDRYLYPRPPPDGASAAFKDFVALVNLTLAELKVVPALNPKGLEQADLTQALTLENSQLKLEFNASTGAISSMQEKGGTRTQWVAPGGALGEFVYRTYTQKADINRYCSQLTPGFQPSDTNLAWWPWSKPGMDLSILNDTAMPPLADCSRAWPVTLKKAWKTVAGGSSDVAQTMLMQLALPTNAVTLFGGMGEITLNVTLPAPSTTPTDFSTQTVELTLTWKNKTATRLAESSWFSFVPLVPEPASGYQLDVLGSPLDPLSVVFNGSRHFHAVHRGVCYTGPPGSAVQQGPGRLAIETLDAPLVAPGDTAHLIDFDNKLPDLSGGFHFNLHNNVGWDASAPWWYSQDAAFRFRLQLNAPQGCWP